MVTARLRELEDEGILVRRAIPESPVRVEYGLTEKGRDLAGVIGALYIWSDRWAEHPSSAEGTRTPPRETGPGRPAEARVAEGQGSPVSR